MPGTARTSVGDVLETTVQGLGYELVDYEISNRGSFVRVFIERPDAKPTDPLSGIRVEDCEKVTRQLQHVFTVENVEYDRLEVSSPGLDRVLKKPDDFRKYSGQEAEVRLRVPVGGRRRFTGMLRGIDGDAVQLEVAGVVHSFAMTDLEKARLVPRFPGPGRRSV